MRDTHIKFRTKLFQKQHHIKLLSRNIQRTVTIFTLGSIRFALFDNTSVCLINFFTSALKSKLLAAPSAFTFLCQFNLSAYKRNVAYLCDESCVPQSVVSSVVCDPRHLLWPLCKIPHPLLTAILLNFQMKIMLSSVYKWFTDMQILTWIVAICNSVNKAVGVLRALLLSNGFSKGLCCQVRRLWERRRL
jgi:hypothetical protein